MTDKNVTDAPALDHLHSFPVHIRNGEVYITASEEKIKAGRRHPEIQCQVAASALEHVVIVGG